MDRRADRIMGTSKILIDGVGIDLTQDTVAANKMLSGIKAHDSNGDSITGNIQTWTGTQASGVKSITANGTHDVTEFASAAVNVDVQFPNFRRFTGTIVSTITGSGVSYDLVTDDLFHTVKDESSLLIILRTDVDPSTPYTLIGCIAANRRFYCGIDVYQNCDRFSTSRDGGFRQFSVPLNSPADYGVGQLYVKNGKLTWYVNSVNYAIRPCNFIVDVMW